MLDKFQIAWEKIALYFVIFLYKFLNLLLDIFKLFLFWRKKIPKGIKKILVFRVGNIGDIICAVPTMVVIRENFPEAKIVLLSSPGKKELAGAKELLTGAEFLDQMIIYYQQDIKNFKKRVKLIKRFKKEKFDLFIGLPQNLASFRILLRNIIFAKLIGVKYTFGFQVNTIKLFKQIQSKYLKFDNEVKRLLKLVRREGLETNKTSFSLPISEKDKKIVREFLNSLGNKNFIIINPNAKRQTYRWSLERFAEISSYLIDNYNVKILIIGGKNDKERTEKLKEMIGKEAIDTAGEFTILQTIELSKHCQLLIGNNSAGVHMAAAAGTPTIGIYTAADFKDKWTPYGDKNIVLSKNPDCQICLKEKCENLKCLNMITVKEVVGAIKSFGL